LSNDIKKFLKVQKENASKWKIQTIITISVLLILILSLVFINYNISDNKKILHNVIAENNKNKSLLDMTTQNLLLLARDANEIRNYLGLSLKDYPVFKTPDSNPDQFANESEEQSDPDQKNDDLLFFKALEKINLNNNKEKSKLIFTEFITNQKLAVLLKNNGLQTREEDDLTLSVIKGTNKFFSIQLNEKIAKIIITDFLGVSNETEAFDPKVSTFMQNQINQLISHYKQLKEKNSALSVKIADAEIKKLFTEKRLTLSAPSEDYNVHKYEISLNKVSLLNLGINKADLSYFINNQIFTDLGQWKEKLINTINELKILNDQEQQIISSHKKLLSIFKDRAFSSLLDSNHLSIIQTPREEHYFTHYDIIAESGDKIGSFAVENFTGEIFIMDKDEIQISSLNALADIEQLNGKNPNADSKKKIKIPEYIPEITDYYKNPKGLTFLLCGSNESNTDTIIIVNVIPENQSITLFAVPRDLYYQGRRINTVYYNQGETEFLKELSIITGLRIEKYIHINMFAFVEVINILGGIDIALENDLIDPTYRIKEDGQWSTLFYKKGFYHLNGIQALRIARSRHFSSDFDRSRRQQKLLIAIKNQFQTIGFTSLNKITTLITALLKYVKTNFSIFEIIEYYNKFKEYSVSAQYTLDTTNILYTTYSNIYLLSEEEKEVIVADAEFDKGAWILLPRQNNWNVIKWYIRELIN